MFPSAFIINSVRNLNYQPSQTQTQNSTQQQSQISASLNVYANVDLLALLHEQPALPTFDRPLLNSSNDERKLAQLHCKEEIIKWLISVLVIDNSNQLGAGAGGQANLPATASYISINSNSQTSGVQSMMASQNSGQTQNMSGSVSASSLSHQPWVVKFLLFRN